MNVCKVCIYSYPKDINAQFGMYRTVHSVAKESVHFNSLHLDLYLTCLFQISHIIFKIDL